MVPTVKLTAPLLCLFLMTGCASAPQPIDSSPGTSVINKNAVLYEGPELVAAVTFLRGKNSVAEEWLILGAELTSPRGSGPNPLARSNISVRAPDGRRFDLLSQTDYARRLARFRIPVDQALSYLPLLYLYQPGRTPSGRWFLEDSPDRVAYEEILISSTQTYMGPLVFHVPGGVQPGRWRLVIELEESRPDIHFFIELKK